MKPTDGKVGCQECRERNNEKARRWHRLNYERVLEHYGKVCACCGESNPSFLTIDHVNNDGYVERSSKKDCTGPSWYARIIRRGFPADLQILCYNCNMGKARCKGVCPHKLLIQEEILISRT